MSRHRGENAINRFVRQHATLVRRVWIASEAGVVGMLAFATLSMFEFGESGELTFGVSRGLALPLAAAFVWAVVLYALGLYHSQRFATVADVWAKLAVAHLLGTFLYGIMLWSAGAPLGALVFVPTCLGALAIERAELLEVIWRVRRAGGQSRRALLIAAAGSVRSVAAAIDENPHLGLRLVATARPDELVRCGELLDATQPDELLFVGADGSLERLADAALEAQLRDINVRVVKDRGDLELLRPGVGRVGGRAVVTVFSKRGRPGEVVAKRLVDVFGGALLLVASAPLTVGVAIAIGLSGGRPIYRQTRVGRFGGHFTMYKFRTMVHDADSRRDDLGALNEMSPPMFKAANDPRVTRLGRFLRRWSIDELPQLVNVLRGDMSLVGPRPSRPHEVEQYETWQKRRLCVKPGITGPWQVAGRSEVDFADWMRLDAEYINQWTFWRDLEILAQTVPTIIMGRGAR